MIRDGLPKYYYSQIQTVGSPEAGRIPGCDEKRGQSLRDLTHDHYLHLYAPLKL